MAKLDPRLCAQCGQDVSDPIHSRDDGHPFKRVSGAPKPQGGGVTVLVWLAVIVVVALVAWLGAL